MCSLGGKLIDGTYSEIFVTYALSLSLSLPQRLNIYIWGTKNTNDTKQWIGKKWINGKKDRKKPMQINLPF